jgi:hypothetical protein
MRFFAIATLTVAICACSAQKAVKAPEPNVIEATNIDTVGLPIEDPELSGTGAIDDARAANNPPLTSLKRNTSASTPGVKELGQSSANTSSNAASTLWHPGEQLTYTIPSGWQQVAGAEGVGLANVVFRNGKNTEINVTLEPSVNQTPEGFCNAVAAKLTADGATVVETNVNGPETVASVLWEKGTQAGKTECRQLVPDRPDLLLVSRGQWPRANATQAKGVFKQLIKGMAIR